MWKFINKKMIKSQEEIISLEKFGYNSAVLVKATRNKNSYIKINRNNEIVFLKSIYMDPMDAQRFLRENIYKFIEQQRLNKENKPYNLEEGWVILFGKYYNLIYGGQGRKYTILDKTIIVYGKDFELAFNNFCSHQKNEIIKLAKNVAEKTTFKPIFKVKLLIAVWGNCNPKLNLISLNQRLIFFRKEVIEYVIHHEIAHYTYQHHQKTFWNLVEEYCPDYKILKKELKNW